MMWWNFGWGWGGWLGMTLLMLVFWGALIWLVATLVGSGSSKDALNPPGESGDSKLIETMLPHRYSNRYRRFAPISRAAYLRSIHTGAGC